MMERAGKNIKRVIIIAAAALLALCMAGIIMVWADGVRIEDSSMAKFTDSAFDQYHDRQAESILGPVGSFHLVAFDTLHLNAHCNGNFATNDLQANSNNGTNNYGSEVNYAKHFTSGSPGAGEDDILVVGDRNTIGTTDGGSAIMLNGSKLDRIKHIIKSENFIDLADWKAQTQAVSDKYKSHSTNDGVTTDFSDQNNQKITVSKAGSYLNLRAVGTELEGIKSSNPLKIDVGNGNNIVINVDCSQVNGTLNLPDCKTILNGQELNNREVTEFNENFITWNFTNIPSGMTINAKLMIGSILAPGATVNLTQNLNGTCAADTIYVKAESHRDDSRGTKPNTPTEEKGSLTFTKTFDGYNVTDQDKNNITFTVKDKDGKVVTEVSLGKMTKGSDGKYTYTVANLTPGNYTVTENNADNVDGYTLVMNESVTSKGTTVVKDKDVTVELKDKYTPKTPEQPTEEKGSLTFTKTFDGYNVTEQDKNNITFTVKDKDGKVVTEVSLGKMTKGSDGKYTYTVANLTPGNYTVTENNADKVDGYTLVTNESVTSKGTTVEKDKNVTVDLKDVYTPNQTTKKYALKVRKTENIDEKDTNKRIRGSRYAMFRWTGQIAAADAQDNALLGASLRVSNVATTAAADQKDPYARFRDLTRADIMKAKDWKKINESDTDTNGEIEKSDNDITPGVYAVMEEVPPAGYQRTANPAIIRLNEDGTKTMIANANGAAELETEGAVQFLRWRETATNVEINKVDEKGDSVKGAVLAIYDKDGAPVETWTSDGTKHRITAKLVAGETYTLKELKAPEGYEKAADETFTVESKDIVGIDQYIQGGIEMIDKTTPTTPNQPVKPAQTVAKGVKTGDPTTIGGLIALIAAAGAVTVLTVKRLRDAE